MSDEISILDVPYQLGMRIGLSPFQAGILATVVVLAMVLFPLAIILRGHGHFFELLAGVGVICFCTAIGWFPIYGVILTVLLTVGLYGKNIKELFS